MLGITNKIKQAFSSGPNHAERRKRAAEDRGLMSDVRKRNFEYQMKLGKDAKRAALAKRVAETKARTELRNNRRKEIAKEHGVNWKRVKLTDINSYIIK